MLNISKLATIALCVVFLSVVHLSEARKRNKKTTSKLPAPTCVEIPSNLTLCTGIGYTRMRQPNLLGHLSANDATTAAEKWTKLSESKCHEHLQLFLCSYLTPVCLDQPLWPCRSLCESVRVSCDADMGRLGLKWPEGFNCSGLPTGDDVCISGAQGNLTDLPELVNTTINTGNQTCEPCRQTTADELRHRYCSADVVAKIMPEMIALSGNDIVITTTKRTKFYKNSLNAKLREKKTQTFYLRNASSCLCTDLTNTTGGKSAGNRPKFEYVVAAELDDDRRLSKLTLTFLHKLTKHSTQLKQEIRSLERRHSCSKTAAKDSGAVRAGSAAGGIHRESAAAAATAVGEETISTRTTIEKVAKKKKVPTATLR